MIDNFPVLAEIVQASPEDERDGLLLYLVSGRYSAEAVASVLRANGYKASASTIRTFRRELAREGVSQ